ncbi:trypsin-like peptidase domain-containing protein [Amnibacterium sp. CER49]|uniref:S1C family serine protease n=1 Tax=Amnibacterium sp. CER49 TaxID=3039161 RepID=UPI002447C20D|nr:trypsin-like peptidase domain-containing protein [Amnibacterium sp. CER49]MDH2445303.1 trypsin-like peptidase domain-containing protein [Amnibacterium sp. CER49]
MTDFPDRHDDDRPARVDQGREVPASATEREDTRPYERDVFAAEEAPGAASAADEPRSAAAAPAAEDPVDRAEGSAFRRSDRRGLLLPVAAVAVVAAVLGGAAGAGITALAQPHDSALTSSTGGSAAQSITINNAKSATVISAVAAKASPSVVTISVNASSESGTGSGIVLSSDGYVLTNNHVVTLDGASSNGTISVTTSNGRIYRASIVGTDPLNDLAVIRLTGASGLTPASFADSSRLNVGDTAIAIGAPLDLPGTVTTGIVSALGRSISIQSSAVPNNGDGSNGGGDNGPFNFWNFGGGSSGGSGSGTTSSGTISLAVIQTDAAINPGNSGGALLDASGQVIGVNVAIASTGSGSATSSQSGNIGVGFAIPSDVAKRIAGELIAKKKATHGLLGASVGDSTQSSSSTVAGALVEKVTSGGAASSAGLRQGDIVTRFNGVPVQSATDLTAQVRALAGGSSAQVTWVRGGETRSATVTLGTYSG